MALVHLQAALEVLNAVEDGTSITAAIEKHNWPLRTGTTVHGLSRELIYGVTRWRAKLDYGLAAYSKRPLTSLPVALRNILRLGLYQLSFLHTIPPYAALNATVELSGIIGHQGWRGYVNGVLRSFLRGPSLDALLPPLVENAADIALNYSHPEWLVSRWLTRFGAEETRALCSWNNLQAPVTLRVNQRQTSAEICVQELARAGFEAHVSPLLSTALMIARATGLFESEAFKNGLFSVQDEPSQLVSLVVAPQPGETILDACAGSGGKTTHLAELADGAAAIFSLDRKKSAIRRIDEHAQRLNLTGITGQAANLLDGGFAAVASFDAILLDAPCSGLGAINRHPEIKWNRAPADIPRMRGEQIKLLTKAAEYLRVGGRLVYSTCSFELEETDEVIEEFLARFKAWRLQPIRFSEERQQRLVASNGMVTLLPQRHGVSGFYIAQLVRMD